MYSLRSRLILKKSYLPSRKSRLFNNLQVVLRSSSPDKKVMTYNKMKLVLLEVFLDASSPVLPMPSYSGSSVVQFLPRKASQRPKVENSSYVLGFFTLIF